MNPEQVKIEIYQDKRRKWRWRLLAQFRSKPLDNQVRSTDPFDSPEEAEFHARYFICRAWAVDSEFKIQISRFARLVNFLKRIFFSWL